MSEVLVSNDNGSVSTMAADSNGRTKEQKEYKVFVLLTHFGEPPQLRILKVAADGLRDARKLADDLVRRLSSEELEDASADPYEIGEGLDWSEVFDVWENRHDIPGHTWTRKEIESDHLNEPVEHAAEEVEAVA